MPINNLLITFLNFNFGNFFNMQDTNLIWKKCCKQLKKILSEDVYERWIAVIEPIEIVDNNILLAVANDFYREWLEENYLPLIDKALILINEENLKAKINVDIKKFKADLEDEKTEVISNKSTLNIGSPNKPKANLNPNYTFDSFVIGVNNQFAHAAAMAAATSPSRTYNPLFIYGDVGLGKTHLMQAIGNYVVNKKPRTKVRYITCEAFTNEYIDALQNNKVSLFRKKYRKIDLLLIDDIQFLDGKNRLQEEFFHTFNTLFESHKQIILTSDRTPSEMDGLAPRLISRFEWGLVTELIKPDVETRTAILRKKAESMKLTIDLVLLDYLAEKITSNIRSLEGALIRIATYVSLTHQKISTEQIDELLKDLLTKEELNVVSVDLIQRTVAEHFDLRVSDITGKRRTKEIAWPRQIAMFLSRTMTNQSFPSIGEKFLRNHATVLYAHETIDAQAKDDDKVNKMINIIKDKISKNIS